MGAADVGVNVEDRTLIIEGSMIDLPLLANLPSVS